MPPIRRYSAFKFPFRSSPRLPSPPTVHLRFDAFQLRADLVGSFDRTPYPSLGHISCTIHGFSRSPIRFFEGPGESGWSGLIIRRPEFPWTTGPPRLVYTPGDHVRVPVGIRNDTLVLGPRRSFLDQREKKTERERERKKERIHRVGFTPWKRFSRWISL